MIGWHGSAAGSIIWCGFDQMVEPASEPVFHIKWVPAVNNLIVYSKIYLN